MINNNSFSWINNPIKYFLSRSKLEVFCKPRPWLLSACT